MRTPDELLLQVCPALMSSRTLRTQGDRTLELEETWMTVVLVPQKLGVTLNVLPELS